MKLLGEYRPVNVRCLICLFQRRSYFRFLGGFWNLCVDGVDSHLLVGMFYNEPAILRVIREYINIFLLCCWLGVESGGEEKWRSKYEQLFIYLYVTVVGCLCLFSYISRLPNVGNSYNRQPPKLSYIHLDSYTKFYIYNKNYKSRHFPSLVVPSIVHRI